MEQFSSRRMVEIVMRKPGLIGARLSHIPRAESSQPQPYVRIVSIEPGSWADSVGLEPGDVLMEINHTAVRLMEPEQFLRATSGRPLRMTWALNRPEDTGLNPTSQFALYGSEKGYTRSYSDYNRRWNSSLAMPPPAGNDMSPLFVDATAMYDLQELQRLEELSQEWWIMQQRKRGEEAAARKDPVQITPKPVPQKAVPPKPRMMDNSAGVVVEVGKVTGIDMKKITGECYLSISLWHGEESRTRQYRLQNDEHPLQYASSMPKNIQAHSEKGKQNRGKGMIDFDFKKNFAWTPREDHYIVIQIWEVHFWNRNQLVGEIPLMLDTCPNGASRYVVQGGDYEGFIIQDMRVIAKVTPPTLARPPGGSPLKYRTPKAD